MHCASLQKFYQWEREMERERGTITNSKCI